MCILGLLFGKLHSRPYMDFKKFYIQDSRFSILLLVHGSRMTFTYWLLLTASRVSVYLGYCKPVLPVTVQRGLFIHNNSFVCDCSTYHILWHWQKEGYEAVRDFKDEYSCQMFGEPLISINFLHSPLINVLLKR